MPAFNEPIYYLPSVILIIPDNRYTFISVTATIFYFEEEF